MRVRQYFLLLTVALAVGGCDTTKQRDLAACATLIAKGLRPVAVERSERFLGKVEEATARCRGGDKAVALRSRPWVDWANYWATGDSGSRATSSAAPHGHLGPNERGIEGALFDLEKGRPNGHEVEVSPLKRVLLRTIPELASELEHTVNAFDPWARDRGVYYSLQWTPRPGAETDPAFK